MNIKKQQRLIIIDKNKTHKIMHSNSSLKGQCQKAPSSRMNAESYKLNKKETTTATIQGWCIPPMRVFFATTMLLLAVTQVIFAAAQQGPVVSIAFSNLYTSEYSALVSPTATNYAGHRLACQALGDGWDLATFPSSSGFGQFTTSLYPSHRTRGFIGAARGYTRRFKWSTGRLEDIYFSNGSACNRFLFPLFTRTQASSSCSSGFWAAGEPQEDSAKDCLALEENKLVAVSCSQSLTLAHCERSRCVPAVDCYEPNTVEMLGAYAPNCRCQCKDGARGPKCQWPLLYAHSAAIVSEYMPLPTMATRTWAQARDACKAVGEGWDLATFPSAASHTAYTTLLSPVQTIWPGWVGGTNFVSAGQWRWATGWVNDRYFRNNTDESGGTCTNVVYPIFTGAIQLSNCYWRLGEPSDASGTHCAYLGFSDPPADLNGVDVRLGNLACASSVPRVVHCERTACTLIDCYAPNTESAAGRYHPSCTCTCKAGFYGAQCQFPWRIDHGLYTSEYRALTIPSGSWDSGRAACKALESGVRGWDIATFPTANAYGLYTRILRTPNNARGWIGAVGTASGIWNWSCGRLRGLVFMSGGACRAVVVPVFNRTVAYSSCYWSTGEPISGAGCAYTVQYDTAQRYGSAPCATTLTKVHCERSLCKQEIDCHGPNTISMEGMYYPCTCVCAAGAWGTRCEFPVTISNGPFLSEYQPLSVLTPRTRNQARAACQTLGSGWDLATFPSAASREAYNALVTTSSAIPSLGWFGIDDVAFNGRWVWSTGRVKGFALWQSSTCYSVQFPLYGRTALMQNCWWDAGEPGSSVDEACASMNEAMRWFDLPCVSSLPTTAHCERSACNINVDCSPFNTLSVVGEYTPNCTCTCKEGTFGDQCQFPIIVDHANTVYESEYRPLIGTLRNQSAARLACQAIEVGGGWDLATFPSKASLMAYLSHLTPRYRGDTGGWIGALSNAAGLWQWTSGRLGGQYFWSGTNCLAFYFSLFDSANSLSFCHWAPGQPDASGVGGFLLGFNDEMRMSSRPPSFAVDVTHCERSLCKQEIDCHGPNTISMEGMYYPCTCVCAVGAWGDKCQWPLTINHGLYRSEYQPLKTLLAVGRRSWFDASAECNAIGKGWDLATFPTDASRRTYSSLLKGDFVLGAVGSDELLGGAGQWMWSTGRMRGVQFWIGNKVDASVGGMCLTAAFPLFNRSYNLVNCPWETTSPKSLGNGCGLIMPSVGLLHADFACNDTANGPPMAHCERVACRLDLDCYGPSTASMTGEYFPDCKCICNDGSFGEQCQFPVVVDHGPLLYVSEYRSIVADAAGWEGGRSLCLGLGDGWDLATFPTDAALRRYVLALRFPHGQQGWTGAVNSSSQWKFGAGRLSGLPFRVVNNDFTSTTSCQPMQLSLINTTALLNMCLWTYRQSSYVEACGVLAANDRMPNGVGCNLTLANTHCERSPCKIGIDCFEPNTMEMIGSYYPNCSCRCKSGASGLKCQFPLLIDHGPYVSEYTPVTYAAGNWNAAQNACQSLQNGWNLATFPTDASFSTYIAALPLALRAVAFLGGKDAAAQSAWQWVTSRLKGLTWWRGLANGTCETMYFPMFNSTKTFKICAWNRNEPNNGNEDCLAATSAAVSSEARFNDLACTTMLLSVAHCERSMCKMGTDCYEPNTVRLVGTYSPNCTCECKPQAWGPKCQFPLVIEYGAYTSEYSPANVSTNGISAARAACAELGDGWDLATFMSTAAGRAYSTALDGAVEGAGWIGTNDTANEGYWRWSAGRLQGLMWYSAGTCPSFLVPLIGGVQQSAFCLWNAGEPNDPSGTEDCAALVAPLTYPVGAADRPCDAPLRTAHCERSPCRMGLDCYALNTRTMMGSYFPHCSCVCVPRAWGDKCQYPVGGAPRLTPSLTANATLSLPKQPSLSSTPLASDSGSVGTTASHTWADSVTLSFSSLSRSKATATKFAATISHLTGGSSATATLSLSASPSQLPTEAPSAIPAPKSPMESVSAGVGEAVGVAVSIAGVASVAGGQLGVANAIARMGSCDDDEEEGGGEASDVPVLVHPLRFSVGEGENGAYAAAALCNGVLIPAVSAAVVRWPLRLLLQRLHGVGDEEALTIAGWPWIVAVPAVTLAEGSGVSVVRALRWGSAAGYVCGALGLLGTASLLFLWGRALAVVVPRRALDWVPAEGGVEEGAQRSQSSSLRRVLLWSVAPTHVWAPRPQYTRSAGEYEEDARNLSSDGDGSAVVSSALLERYGNALGDKRLYYAEVTSFVCSLAVGAAEGLPTSMCKPRVVLAATATLLQCALSCLSVTPLVLGLQCIVSLSVAPIAVLMVVQVFAGGAAAAAAEGSNLPSAVSMLLAMSNLAGMALLVLALAVGAKALFSRQQGPKRHSSQRRRRRFTFADVADNDARQGGGDGGIRSGALLVDTLLLHDNDNDGAAHLSSAEMHEVEAVELAPRETSSSLNPPTPLQQQQQQQRVVVERTWQDDFLDDVEAIVAMEQERRRARGGLGK